MWKYGVAEIIGPRFGDMQPSSCRMSRGLTAFLRQIYMLSLEFCTHCCCPTRRVPFHIALALGGHKRFFAPPRQFFGTNPDIFSCVFHFLQ